MTKRNDIKDYLKDSILKMLNNILEEYEAGYLCLAFSDLYVLEHEIQQRIYTLHDKLLETMTQEDIDKNIWKECELYMKYLKEKYNKKLLSRRIKKYKLDEDQFNQLKKSQEGKCAICNTKFKDSRDMHVDHNHTNEKVRQLLCNGCNVGIGMLKDDTSIILKAAEYLNKWK